MKKSELIVRLNQYAHRCEALQGEHYSYARFLARYFDSCKLPQDARLPERHIDYLLPQLTVRAIQTLYTGTDAWIVSLRKSLRIGFASAKRDAVNVDIISDVIASATESEDIAERVRSYLEAERRAVDVTFYRFMESVYRYGGLNDKIRECADHSMSGKFGKTWLRTYRRGNNKLLISFVRQSDSGELVVSYGCSEDDPLGLSGKVETCYATWLQAAKMINEVIKLWPSDAAAFAPERVLSD